MGNPYVLAFDLAQAREDPPAGQFTEINPRIKPIFRT